MTWQFPDAEAVAVALLTPIVPAVTALPPGWEQNLPIMQVNRIGGNCDDVTDVARLQLAIWHNSRAEVWQIAKAVRAAVLASGGETVDGVMNYGEPVDGVLIDTASEAVAGQQLPGFSPDDRRVIATYQLAFREQDL